jgi:hypothetical protein
MKLMSGAYKKNNKEKEKNEYSKNRCTIYGKI